MHVDRLVNCGLLTREEVPGDRRKTLLVCTDKAAGTVVKGREYQHLFAARLLSGLSEDDIAAFRRTLSHIDANIDGIRKSGI